VSETVRGWARVTLAGCASALRVTSLTPAFTVSCACSVVGVEPGEVSVHDAVLFPVGQPVVNEGVWPESRTRTFPGGQFSAQTCTVNCAGWPGLTLPDGFVTLRHRLAGDADPVGLGVELTSVATSEAVGVLDGWAACVGEGGGDDSADDVEGDGVLVSEELGDGVGVADADGLGVGEGDGLALADGLEEALADGLGEAVAGCPHT
jgi:hypothetical protein